MNIFAPNDNHHPFFNIISELLADYSNISIILGGDFNTCPQPNICKSRHPSLNDMKISKALVDLCNGARLADVWRISHGVDRNYTFYSNVHKTYSRIDSLWVTQDVLSNTSDSKISLPHFKLFQITKMDTK